MNSTERVAKHRKKKSKTFRWLITHYLGRVCVVCGETQIRKLRSHEKFGQPHPDIVNTPLAEVKANCKSGRFVRVCERCHRKAHSLIDREIVDWDTIQHYIKEFVKANPNGNRWAWDRFIDVKLNKPVGQQLELPVEVETVKTKLELEQERVMAENRLKFKQREIEEDDNWEDNLEDDQRITPRLSP